jgi:hypothetical protein
VAGALSIHRDTAFRWRHRLLPALEAADPGILEGTVAVRDIPFPYSEKGRRGMGNPRRRGWGYGWRQLIAPKVWVMIARAEDGRVSSAVAGPRRPRESDYARMLAQRLRKGAILVSDRGHAGGPAAFARRYGFQHREGPYRHDMRIAALDYGARFRAWLKRFRGVATRYLGNYLAWHRDFEVTPSSDDYRSVRRLLTANLV